MIGKFGKLPALRDTRTLRLADYLDTGRLPPPPMFREWSPALGQWDVYGNDAIGNCVFASAAHAIQCWTANDGAYRPVTTADVNAAYSAVTGYDPARPETDRGAHMLDALRYWRREGIGGHAIEAFVEIDPHNHRQRMLATELFGCVYAGFGLPSTIWSEPLWADTRADPWSAGGHAMTLVDFGPHVLGAVTWGRRQRMTPEFVDRYCEEMYAIVSPDWTGADLVAPNGLRLDQLRADLARVTA